MQLTSPELSATLRDVRKMPTQESRRSASVPEARFFAPGKQLGYLSRVAALTSAQVRILDRYALYDEIASGGMATVHVGRLLGPVGFSRTVAIKRLHPQYAKERDFVSMFLDEARLAARIRHPNVVGTLDVVALDGELFLIMEYIHGESLSRLMRAVRDRDGSIPIPVAASILVDVLEGLHAAHEATDDHGEPLGIVHRDVSPQNILVGTDGIARVLDFGVAKAAGRVQNTRDGQLKGKLGYMAPEQIAGRTTRATDLHAASVVLWEMLTGRRLYHADNELQTYANILAGAVQPPSVYNSEVAHELDELVLRGLNSNPEARFASAREMARALQRATRVASASDVGDWLEEIAGPDVRARAQKITAIESTGAMPPASPQESRDPVLPSSPPVSMGMGLGRGMAPASRGRLGLIPVLAALAAVAAIGAYYGASIRQGGTRGENAASLPVRAPARPPAAPSAWVPSATPPAAPMTIPSSTSQQRAKPSQLQGLKPTRGTSTAAAPSPPTQRLPSESAGAAQEDFSHVLDSRK